MLYLPYAFQFLTGPHASGGVVGVAEQEEGGLLIGTSLFEVVPVYLEGVVVAKPQHTHSETSQPLLRMEEKKQL